MAENSKARWIPKSNMAGKNSKNKAQFFALLPAYHHFRFWPCWLHKPQGFWYPRISIFFGTHECISFCSRIRFLWWAFPKGVNPPPLGPPLCRGVLFRIGRNDLKRQKLQQMTLLNQKTETITNDSQIKNRTTTNESQITRKKLQ